MRTHDQGRDHEHDESVKAGRESRDQASAELPHLLKAAAAGRTDVIGRSGMTTLQRAVGNAAVGAALQRDAEGEPEHREPRSSVHDVLSSGGGQPLDTGTRTDMEGRLGADFSSVRVHTGSAAHDSAKEIGAHAYTVGDNIVFQRDSHDFSSHQGRTTLAHELTHVIQQRNGPVDGTAAPGGIRVSDPSDRFEQEASANAERALAAPAPTPTPASEAASPQAAPSSAPAVTAPVQRQAADEEEEPADVQGSFVQRAAEGGSAEEEESASEA
ncbi:eCIS core domain-containing protein [Streptomyces olivaceoviridis]|uniref:eCIS core domain-containing protein n=1 Tax=Streptomyces olivaceoviridis TaxID=1921 RepID=UPI0036FB6F0D